MTSATGTMTTGRYRAILAGAIVVLGLTCAACSRADADPVDLRVVDRETGQELRTWRHHGHLFVAGEPGARYSLRVVNHTGGRVMLVMSVDGVNILTGETADYGQNGYVLSPYESYDVTGWRKSDSEVAAFAFAPLSQSYAARTGRPTDVGVIGMAVFRELAPPVEEAPAYQPEARDEPGPGSADAASGYDAGSNAPRPAPPAPLIAPAPTAQARSGSGVTYALKSDSLARSHDERLGTAHGAREWSVVYETTFERATPWPWYVRQIQYDTFHHLVACGVIPRWRQVVPPPRPFPSSPDGAGFVRDPPPIQSWR